VRNHSVYNLGSSYWLIGRSAGRAPSFRLWRWPNQYSEPPSASCHAAEALEFPPMGGKTVLLLGGRFLLDPWPFYKPHTVRLGSAGLSRDELCGSLLDRRPPWRAHWLCGGRLA